MSCPDFKKGEKHVSFREKVALVTGAGSGIGKAVALELAEKGAKVIAAGRTKEKLDDVVNMIKNLGNEALTVQVDVRSDQQIKNLIEEVINHYGHLDFACNAAGVGGPLTPTADISGRDFVPSSTLILRACGFV